MRMPSVLLLLSLACTACAAGPRRPNAELQKQVADTGRIVFDKGCDVCDCGKGK